ncbi:MAG: SDR family oxidoreductase, partial [Acidimicrobiales bacterium]
MTPTAATGPLHAQVVLVTGGGRGLGRGLVEGFADAGATVVACGRHVPDHTRADAFEVCDVRDAEAAAGLVRSVAERFGRLDVVVNNAGGAAYAPASDLTHRAFERVVALNLLAPFYVSQPANTVMQSQAAGGVILNIGSAVTRRPAPGMAPYNAAKAGLTNLTRSLALEWAPKVRVNQVTVGLLETELAQETYGDDLEAVRTTVPMGRMAHAPDVVAACLALCGDGMGYVTGADLWVDGGGEP